MLLAAAVVFGGCGSDDEAGGGGRSWGGGQPGMAAAVPVRVEAAGRGDISNYILKNVTLEAERWVDVRSRTSGQVVDVVKEEGDAVREGSILARLDADATRLQAEQMKVAYEEALRRLKRVEEMYQKNLVSKEDAEDARTNHDRALAPYEQAKLNLAYTEIKSPVDGVVTIRSVELGNMVSNNQVVFSVADFDPLLARIRVTEREFGNIRLRQKARITVESDPDTGFEGLVTMISPVVDPESGTIKVTIEIPRPAKGGLRPGMFASVYIITATHQQTVVIPKKSLVLEGEGNQVFVYEADSTGAGHAVRRKVTIGFTDTDRLEVLEGIRPGEQIVTVGQEGLRPGTAVRIVGQAPVQAAVLEEPAQQGGASGGRGWGGASGGATAGASGGGQGGRGWGGGGGQMTPEALKAMQSRMFERFPKLKEAYDEKVKADSTLATDPRKWQAFMGEMRQKGVIQFGGGGGGRSWGGN